MIPVITRAIFVLILEKKPTFEFSLFVFGAKQFSIYCTSALKILRHMNDHMPPKVNTLPFYYFFVTMYISYGNYFDFMSNLAKYFIISKQIQLFAMHIMCYNTSEFINHTEIYRNKREIS